MSAAAIRNLNLAFNQFDVETARGNELRNRNDAQMGIDEIEVLRLDLDMVAPPEAADLAEPLVESYRGNVTSGDHLRLPQLTNHDGPRLRAAVGRVLAADTSQVGGSQNAIVKEERMRRVLKALDSVVADIKHNASMSLRD